MPYFEITDGNGTSHTGDLLSEDPTDIKAEFKKFEAKRKAKKAYISTKEDKLKSVKVYEPKTQAELDDEARLESHLDKKAGIYQEETN